MIRLPSFLALSSVVLVTLTAACSHDASSTSDDQVVANRRLVAGYDLNGPAVLGAASGEICAAVVSEERAACERTTGTTIAAANCRELCSAPIAPAGNAAGYDFTGFHVLPNAHPAICAAVVDPVQDACYRAGGVDVNVDNCGHLCSLPIAPEGKVAGYSMTGLEILAAAGPTDICAAVISETRAQCYKLGGVSVDAAGCVDLCSLPLR